jgi:hypothetical protein
MIVLQPGRGDRLADRLIHRRRSCRSRWLACVAIPASLRRSVVLQYGPVDCGLSDPCPMDAMTALILLIVTR